jgi:hypothetical protein
MRTQDEIINWCKEIKDEDIFGFMRGDALMFVEWKKALESGLIKEDTTEEEWGEVNPNTKEKIEEIMLDYMPFAWEKANGFRGLSASRSIMHYTAWTWLHSDEAHDLIPKHWEYYGKDVLVSICEHFGWDHTQWDDGVRLNHEPV